VTALPSRSMRIAGALAATAVVSVVAATPAMAADGGDGVKVVNTETVQVYLDSSGQVDTQRVYEQLSLTGQGDVDLENPVSTSGLRNLDGFSGFDIQDGKQVVKTSVDGEDTYRSVSDFDGKLPLKVAVAYKLDGKTVEPGDVVGENGRLEVQFTVENVTSQEQQVTFDDGKGGTVTKTAEVPIPIVGSLSTTAPSSFTNVASDQANIAGDGKGGTKLSFTMTLFPPIGSTKTSFGYTADITNGVVPRVEISALPVNPLESPTFKSAADSYQGGADTGADLTAGATEIDSNLLKLRDGASDLLAGLIKLHSGANQLNDGLANQAAPGAAKLADGAEQLDDGLVRLKGGAQQLADGTGQLDDGAKKLDDGAGRLSDGASDARDGSKKLTNGLKQISGGLDKLADGQTGLPKAKDGIKQLQDGIDLMLMKVGDVDTDGTLIGGLADLETGLGDGQAGAQRIAGGLQLLRGDGTEETPGLVGAKGGVDQVKAGLDESLKPGGSLDQLLGGLQAVKTNFCATHPTLSAQCTGTVDALIAGATKSKADLTLASGGLGQVSTGLGTALGALDTQLIPGANELATKLGTGQAGATKLKNGAIDLKGGLAKVRGGLDDLSAGVTKAVTGVMQLSSGAGDAYAGSSDLTDGLGRLDSGAGDLSAGASQLAGGTGQLDAGADKLAAGAGDAQDGSGQIADGADTLADGLQGAADGSGRLADGLGEAADGAPKLVNGAQKLSDKGTKKLVAAGETTAQNYGEMVAVMDAGAKRAQTEDMAYGAPENALGLTAYSYVIDGEDGEGGRNLARTLGGLAALGAGAGVLLLRRRLV